MKPSDWKAPEPTTVSSAIVFHCATVSPAGSAAAALRAVPAEAATASATAATAATRRTQERRVILLTSRPSMSAAAGGVNTSFVVYSERRASTALGSRGCPSLRERRKRVRDGGEPVPCRNACSFLRHPSLRRHRFVRGR